VEERRRFSRGKTYLGGRIAFNHRWSTLDCLVRNLSQDGARIAFAAAAPIPGEFEVTIHGKGENRCAHMIWRDERQAGIQFLSSANDNRALLEIEMQLVRLRAERAALARRVAELSEY
jgi:hypothetical protein